MAEDTRRNLEKLFVLMDYKIRDFFGIVIEKLIHKLYFS